MGPDREAGAGLQVVRKCEDWTWTDFRHTGLQPLLPARVEGKFTQINEWGHFSFREGFPGVYEKQCSFFFLELTTFGEGKGVVNW